MAGDSASIGQNETPDVVQNAAPSAGAAASKPAEGNPGPLGQGEIDALLNQAESALASIDTPAAAHCRRESSSSSCPTLHRANRLPTRRHSI